eukprot:1419310-Amphidinium_carterae.1
MSYKLSETEVRLTPVSGCGFAGKTSRHENNNKSEQITRDAFLLYELSPLHITAPKTLMASQDETYVVRVSICRDCFGDLCNASSDLGAR